MYRRVEIRYNNQWQGAHRNDLPDVRYHTLSRSGGPLDRSLDLPVPPYYLDFTGTQFWYTALGWKQFGIDIAGVEALGFTCRVLVSRKLPGKVRFRDLYQIAVEVPQ